MEIDIRSLKESKVLSSSIEDDRRRKEIDDAKKRAAAQNVDYPAFAALVSAAHLKPVAHKSLRLPKLEDKFSPAWSFDSSGIEKKDVEAYSSSSKSCSTMISSNSSSSSIDPRKLTSDMFRRQWSQLSTSKERCEFLARVPACNLRNIFKVEVPQQILDSILETLSHSRAAELDAAQVLSLLDSLSDCPRFTISLKLCRPMLVSAAFERVLDRLQNSELLDEARALQVKYAEMRQR